MEFITNLMEFSMDKIFGYIEKIITSVIGFIEEFIGHIAYTYNIPISYAVGICIAVVGLLFVANKISSRRDNKYIYDPIYRHKPCNIHHNNNTTSIDDEYRTNPMYNYMPQNIFHHDYQLVNDHTYSPIYSEMPQNIYHNTSVNPFNRD